MKSRISRACSAGLSARVWSSQAGRRSRSSSRSDRTLVVTSSWRMQYSLRLGREFVEPFVAERFAGGGQLCEQCDAGAVCQPVDDAAGTFGCGERAVNGLQLWCDRAVGAGQEVIEPVVEYAVCAKPDRSAEWSVGA